MHGNAPAGTAGSADATEADDGSDSRSEIEVVDSAEAKEPEIIYDVPQRYMNADESGLMITVPSEGSSELNVPLVD